jgi:glycosyltransferase involved in cell wall biosynthesis
MIHAVGVIVPAANEQASIGACLDSLAEARSHLQRTSRRPIDVRIVVVLDGCVDGTAAHSARPGIELVHCALGRAGAARALGARTLLRSWVAPRRLWLANTDADSIVPPDWLSTQLECADRGADLVLGTVLPGPGLSARSEQAWLANHVLRDGHPHVHGANLGIRADTYTALGGWPDRATGEDVALAARAASAGHLRIVRTATIPVLTSARMSGRAPDGFARYLRELAPSIV